MSDKAAAQVVRYGELRDGFGGTRLAVTADGDWVLHRDCEALMDRMAHEAAMYKDMYELASIAFENANKKAAAAERRVAELSELLDEVRCCFTRDDDMPNELLPRIDTALAPAKKVD